MTCSIMSEPLEGEDSYGEPESEAMEMDLFTSLMFEDMEEDGITGGTEDASEEEEERVVEGEEHARKRITPGGELSTDGVCAIELAI